jgi:hypothetical protein
MTRPKSSSSSTLLCRFGRATVFGGLLGLLTVQSASGQAASVDPRHFSSMYMPGNSVAVTCVSPLGVSSRLFRPAVVRAVADVKRSFLERKFPEKQGFKVNGFVTADFSAFSVVGPKLKVGELLSVCSSTQKIPAIRVLPTAKAFRVGPLTKLDQYAYPEGSPTRRGFAETDDDATVKEINVALKTRAASEVSTAAITGEFELSEITEWASRFRFGRLPTQRERFRTFAFTPGVFDVPDLNSDTYVWKLDTSSMATAECWRVAVEEKFDRLRAKYLREIGREDYQLRELVAMEGTIFAFNMGVVSETLDRVGIIDILTADFVGPSKQRQSTVGSFTVSDVIAKESSLRATDLFRWGVPVFPTRDKLTARECKAIGFPVETALRLY